MRVKNRIVMLPMGSNFAMPDGSISDGHINYYRMRAKGGKIKSIISPFFHNPSN